MPPGALFLREHLNGIPVVPNCLENGGAPTRFIERQVIRVLEIARHFRHGSATDRDYAFGPNHLRPLAPAHTDVSHTDNFHAGVTECRK